MMHGTEQSDTPIVPMKPVNKAARAAAEPAEGSGGTKRNADLQSTVRTQSRDAVSQAQGRIREAVNRNKKERRTSLPIPTPFSRPIATPHGALVRAYPRHA